MLLAVEKVESPLSRSIRPRYILSGQCIEIDSFDHGLDSRALCRDSNVARKIRTNRRAAGHRNQRHWCCRGSDSGFSDRVNPPRHTSRIRNCASGTPTTKTWGHP